MNPQAGIDRLNTLLSAGARVSRSVASILDLPLLLNRTVDIICDEFGFYYAGVFLVDATKQYAVLKAGRGEAGRAMISEGHKLLIGGTSMIGDAIQQRTAHIALDVGKEAVFFKNPNLSKTRSEMALPLIAGDEVIGALTVQSEEEAAFSESDISALQTMTDQLAVAIQNASLHQQNQNLLRQAERRARLLTAANSVGKEVTSVLSLDELLPTMVNTIVESYGFYYAGIFLVDSTGQWAELRAGYGESGQSMLAEGHKLEVGGNSMIGTCIRLNEARIALDVGEERAHFKNPHLPNTRSEMALPLPYGDTVLGAVTVQSVEERAFSQDDITTLQTMADHLAVAIQNAYTLEALKAAHSELLRTKVYEALTLATTEAIHWIGNKAVPITMTIHRLKEELSEGEPDIESLKEDLDLIAESADMIVAVKEQLIGQAREQRPRLVLLDDVLRAAALERGIQPGSLHIQIAPEASYVIADSTQLERALGSVLQNAVDAKAKNITVTARSAESGFAVITIEDDGAGMSPELLDKVWTPFYSTKAGHTGLGLPAALHVVSQLQGSMQIGSVEGRGTDVEIFLPSGLPMLSQTEGGPEKIQLIDDNDSWAQSFAASLGKRVMRDMKPNPSADLIIVDEHLESADLGEVLKAIDSAGLGERTVIVTAALNVDRMTRHLKIVRDVVIKPYTAEEIGKLWK